MPGHIGTAIAMNSRSILKEGDEAMTPEELAQARARMKLSGVDPAPFSDAQIAAFIADMGRRFQDDAPTTAAQATKIILDGVKEGRWRILVGDDAHRIDAQVRATPEAAYEPDFVSPFGFTQDRQKPPAA